MKEKITMLATILLLFATVTLSAQTKYEFGTLRCFPGASINLIKMTGITFTTKDGIQVINKKPKNPFVKLEVILNELSGQGWEVYHVTTTTPEQGVLVNAWYSYHLRKKVE